VREEERRLFGRMNLKEGIKCMNEIDKKKINRNQMFNLIFKNGY